MKKKYTTNLIDEATFYLIKGFEHDVVRKGQKASAWTYIRTPEFERARRMFFTGSPLVPLHKWLSIRNELKYEQLANDIIDSKKKSIRKDGPKTGDKYYYISPIDKTIQSEFFGRNEKHQERFKSGNFYLSKEEAKLAQPKP